MFNEAYNSYKYEKHFHSDDYKIAMKCLPAILNKAYFPFSKLKEVLPEITYRQITVWDDQKLIDDYREETDERWRKFSVIGLILLQIIDALRRIGLPYDKIKEIVDGISKSIINNGNPSKKERFYELEFGVLNVLNGKRVILIIDTNNTKNIVLLPEEEAVNYYLKIWTSSCSIIALPFFNFVQNVVQISGESPIDIKEPSTAVFKQKFNMFTPQERKVLGIMRSGNFTEISVEKSTGEKMTLRETTRKGGTSIDDLINTIEEDDYNTVTIVRRNGKIASIKKEVTHKI
jgi:DNA-binding transcriptional MerR regulator